MAKHKLLYGRAFEDGPVGIAVISPDQRIVDTNRPFRDMLDYGPADITGLELADITYPGDWDRERPLVEALLDGRSSSLQMEKRYLRRDGSTVWGHLTAWIVESENGAERCTLHMIQDITQRRLADHALRQNDARYRLLVETMSDGLTVKDAQDRISYANERFCQMLGYRAEELLGRRADDIHDRASRRIFHRQAAKRRRGFSEHYETSFLHKSGRPIHAIVAPRPLFDEEGAFVGSFAVVTDITARRQEEAQRLQRERTLRTTLVNEVHHRIKNHLQGITGLLRSHATARPALAAPIAQAIGQVQSIAAVHGLLGRNDSEQVLLCELMEAIADSARTLLEATVRPIVEMDIVCPVRISEHEAVPVALILNELLLNAIRHGGHHDQDAAVQLRLDAVGTAARVRIYNPRGTLPAGLDLAQGKGLGTGLTLVRSLLPREGARLSLTDADGGVLAELRLSPPVITPLPACGRNGPVPTGP
ncbi:MAG: PAS domain S-box protein [Gammaproteobacteria bacterium]|jgi:PAS domain S-box-containing protein